MFFAELSEPGNLSYIFRKPCLIASHTFDATTQSQTAEIFPIHMLCDHSKSKYSFLVTRKLLPNMKVSKRVTDVFRKKWRTRLKYLNVATIEKLRLHFSTDERTLIKVFVQRIIVFCRRFYQLKEKPSTAGPLKRCFAACMFARGFLYFLRNEFNETFAPATEVMLLILVLCRDILLGEQQ